MLNRIKPVVFITDVVAMLLLVTVFRPCPAGMHCQSTSASCMIFFAVGAGVCLLSYTIRLSDTILWLLRILAAATVLVLVCIPDCWCKMTDMRCNIYTRPLAAVYSLVSIGISLAMLVKDIRDRKAKYA